MARLDELGTIITGNTPKTADIQNYASDDILFVKPSDISDSEITHITSSEFYISEYARSNARIIPANSVLVTCIGIIGKVAIADTECAFNQQINAIIPNEKCLPTYLAYAIQNHKQELRDTANAAVVPIINKSQFSSLQINVPSLPVQTRIVQTLDAVTTLIAVEKIRLAKLDELVKSRFIELFGNCKTNPKQWKTLRLDEVADVGSSKRVFVEELKSEGIPFYRGTEVGALAEGKAITPELFITPEHYKELCDATGTPQVGDLLMPSICPDGRIWVVNTDAPFYFKDGRVLWVHNISNSLNPVFLLYTLRDRIMTDYLSIASGTTFAELKIFSLKTCQVFDVPIELQNEFAAFVEQTDKLKLAVKESLGKLETLKKKLMQDYFG